MKLTVYVLMFLVVFTTLMAAAALTGVLFSTDHYMQDTVYPRALIVNGVLAVMGLLTLNAVLEEGQK